MAYLSEQGISSVDHGDYYKTILYKDRGQPRDTLSQIYAPHTYNDREQQKIVIEFGYPDFDVLNEDMRVGLSKRFNILFTVCFVITIQELSHGNEYGNEDSLFIKVIETAFNKAQLYKKESNIFLGILEHASVRGRHIHVVMFNNRPWEQSDIDLISKKIDTAIMDTPIVFDGKKQTLTPVISHQKIKSVASYINYLKKNPRSIISNDNSAICMFLGFDRTHIFPADSLPRKQKYIHHARHHHGDQHTVQKINSNDEVVLFMMAKMNKNITSYNEIMRDSNIQRWLHIPQLHAIYTNCYQQFVATCTHENNIKRILNDYLLNKDTERLGCFCPLLEWLETQNINRSTFNDAMGTWLKATTKENAFVFLGTPNSGKSHIARLIWQLFPLHTRIIQDGLFTFANLINSGCGLWEEPYIVTDYVDTTKLILEGCEDVQIAIKNKPSQALGKRVPIIITTNKPLSKYVSGESLAFDVRCKTIQCDKTYNPSLECQSHEHYCFNIEAVDRTDSRDPDASCSVPGKRKRKTSDCETTCTGYHKLEYRHVKSYICWILFVEYISRQPDTEFGKYLHKLVDERKFSLSSFCTLSLNSGQFNEARNNYML